VDNTDVTDESYSVETDTKTKVIENNTQTNNMISLKIFPNYTAPEMKIKLTQQATQGAISWRLMKIKGSIGEED